MKLTSAEQKRIWDIWFETGDETPTELEKFAVQILRDFSSSAIAENVAVANGEIDYGRLHALSGELWIPELEQVTTAEEFWFEIALRKNHIKALKAYYSSFEGELLELPESMPVFLQFMNNEALSPRILDSYVGLGLEDRLCELVNENSPDERAYYDFLIEHPSLTPWAINEMSQTFLDGMGLESETDFIVSLLCNPSMTELKIEKALELYLYGFAGDRASQEFSIQNLIKEMELRAVPESLVNFVRAKLHSFFEID